MRSYLFYQRAALALLAAALTGCAGVSGSGAQGIGALPVGAATTHHACESLPIVRPVYILAKVERFRVASGAYTVEALNSTLTVRKSAEDPALFDVLPTTNQSVPAATIRVTDDATKATLEFRVSMWVTGKVVAVERAHAIHVAQQRPAACDQSPIVQPVNLDPTGSYYALIGGPHTVTSSSTTVAIQVRDHILQVTGVGVKPVSSDAVITVTDTATGASHSFRVVYPGV